MTIQADAAALAAARNKDRYSAVAIGLHWAIAAALVIQLVFGWRMEDAEGATRSLLLQMHKTVGVAILVLTAVRLIWRLANPPPPADGHLTPFEKRSAHAVHIAFYTALLALPLTGWAMVSAQRAGAMRLLGGVRWPDLPLISALPGGAQDVVADGMGAAHTALVWMMVALFALHVLGALKHQYVSKDPTIARMAPGARPGSLLEPRLLAIPVIAALLAALGYGIKAAQPVERPRAAKIADADIFLDVVQPIMSRRCGSCHNDDQPKGGLSLTSYDGFLQGGRSGTSILAGHADRSVLLRRMTLPTGDPKFMPKDGKPQLTAPELAAVRWWIDQGAPASARVATLQPSAEAQAALASLLAGSSEEQAGSAVQLAVVPAAKPELIKAAVADGFILRNVAKGSNLLVADYVSSKPITTEALADIAKIGPQIYSLNLRHAGVTDAQLHGVSSFSHLARLRVEDNLLTDAAVKDIAALPQLAYLNLSNTKVTDAGLGQAAAMPGLKELYVWGTPVTAAGVQKAQAEHKGLMLWAGLKASDVKVSTKILLPVN